MTAFSENFPYSTPDDTHRAQELHTEGYLRAGFIQPNQLDSDGIYRDDSSERSEPIVVELGGKATTMRLIHTDKKKGGLLSLPTLRRFPVDARAVADVANVTRISALRPEQAVELSGLAAIAREQGISHREAFDATRQTYATGLRRSLDQGHRLWVMNVDKKIETYLKMRLGPDSYTQIGEPRQYMGDPTTPIAMNPVDTVRAIVAGETGRFSDENFDELSHVMQGVSERYLPRKLVKQLHNNGIETTPENLAAKAWHNKKTAFYAGIVGYSALRFLPVAAVEEFEGNLAAFAAIDIGTAVTQVSSMELFFKGKKRATRMVGAAGTALSFAAPYAYFYANGQDYPWYVNAVAGGFVALGVGLEVDRSIRDNRLTDGLTASDLPLPAAADAVPPTAS